MVWVFAACAWTGLASVTPVLCQTLAAALLPYLFDFSLRSLVPPEAMVAATLRSAGSVGPYILVSTGLLFCPLQDIKLERSWA